jgi:hypothetical protein
MNVIRQKKVARVYTVNLERRKTFVLPAGKYFIGDPTYFLHKSLTENLVAGHFALPDGRGFIAAASEAGILTASNGEVYGVESGLIGICSYDIGDMANFTGDGSFHVFDSDVKAELDDSYMKLSSGNWSLEIELNEGPVFSDDDGYDSYS